MGRFSQLAIVVLLLCIPIGSKSAGARCPVSESNPKQTIEFDRWQDMMTEVDEGLGDAIRRFVTNEIGPGAVVHKALAVNNRSVVTWYACNTRGCKGGVLFLNANPERLRIIRQGILPHNELVGHRSGKAFRVLNTVVEDVDSDSDMELVVRYEIDGPRRPTTGIQTYEYMAVYNLPDLNMQLFFRLGQHGGGDFQEFCSYKVERRDFNCDRRTDLLIVQECGMNMCFEEGASERDCKGQPREKKWHLYWQKDNDIYAGKKGYANVEAIADDRPYLVVAGSFAVAGTEYKQRAKTLRNRLSDAGFTRARIHNSRQFRRLACCYRTLIVDRFADKESADKLLKQLKQKGFKGFVRRGF